MNSNKNILAAHQLHEDSFDVLNMPHVRSRLGTYVDKLSELIERSIVVDVDNHGFLQIEKSDSSSVPVVALNMGQRALLSAEDSGMTRQQRRSLVGVHGEAGAHQFANDFANNLRQNEQHHEAPIFDRSSHFAYAAANTSVYDQAHMVIGRPYVAMNMGATVNGRLSPIVFLHELTHVGQKEARPVQEGAYIERNKVRDELEAYHVAAQVIFGLLDAGRQTELLSHLSKKDIDHALKVEAVRIDRQKTDDPFSPNDQVVKGLIDNNLGVTMLLRGMIKQHESSKNTNRADVLTH